MGRLELHKAALDYQQDSLELASIREILQTKCPPWVSLEGEEGTPTREMVLRLVEFIRLQDQIEEIDNG